MSKELFSLKSLLLAWFRLRKGKKAKEKVMAFERHLFENLALLESDLRSYKHGSYSHFIVTDSKKRSIHEAMTKDKVVHEVITDYLYAIYEPEFIKDSYSSRKWKGSHKAVKTLRYFLKLSASGGRPAIVLKCDVRKYFQNIDHFTLIEIIKIKVTDPEILEIIIKIIKSFDLQKNGKGIPLGNVTSQIFANIYLHELDKFVKNRLKARFYIRYNDDFVIIDNNSERLKSYLSEIRLFLLKNLKLEVPEGKASIRKISWGVDFLGYTILKNGMLLRDSTKAKMLAKINERNAMSYWALIKDCNAHNLRNKLKSILNRACEFEN